MTTENTYEGYVKYADDSVLSTQCSEDRHGECPQPPDDEETGTPPGGAIFGGYYCECGCGHEAGSEAGEPDLSRYASMLPRGYQGQPIRQLPEGYRDMAALDQIAEMLRDPRYGAGMLEDIAELVRKTGRVVENYPDERPTWDRH